MKISFCTQIKNRFHQFKEVFYENIASIQNQNIEWIIVDVNSTDGIDSFMSKNISNNIHYYQVITNIEYSIPIAKNFAVRLSRGDYVFNLDADNFISNAISSIVLNKYAPIYCNKYLKGVYGRIGCDKKIFVETSGYDESFYPAGYHEADFIERCKLIGYNFIDVNCHKYPLQNSKEDTVQNFDNDVSWKDMNLLNKKKSEENLVNKIVRPNTEFTKCSFLYNFQKQVILGAKF
jgi:glycosyltransferase involved in cell wall biosynthesis